MNPGLILKAEAVVAAQLITRHRAPPLAVVAVTVGVIVAAKAAVPESDGGISPTVLITGAAVVQGAVFGSRLSTPAALATGRAAGAPVLGLVVGRLAGTAVLSLPVVFVQTVVAVPLMALGSMVMTGCMLTVSAAAGAMAIAPRAGATGAAALTSALGLGIVAAPTVEGALLHTRVSGPGAGLLMAAGVVIATSGAAVGVLRERPAPLSEPASPGRRPRRWMKHARR